MTYLGAAVVGPGIARLTAPGAELPRRTRCSAVRTCRRTGPDVQRGGRADPGDRSVVGHGLGKLVINAADERHMRATGASGDSALRSEATSTWLDMVAEETAAVATARASCCPMRTRRRGFANIVAMSGLRSLRCSRTWNAAARQRSTPSMARSSARQAAWRADALQRGALVADQRSRGSLLERQFSRQHALISEIGIHVGRAEHEATG